MSDTARGAITRDGLRTAALAAGALLAAAALARDARGAWLLVPLAGLLVVAARAHRAERRGRRRLAFLFDATHALLVSADAAQALAATVTRGREAFHAELGEAVLLPAGAAPPRRTRVTDAGAEPMAPVGPESAQALRALAAGRPGTHRLTRPDPDPALERYLAEAGARGEVIVSVLPGEDAPLGVLLFARPDAARRFGGDDLDLLGKLASQAAATLAHESLEEDFGRLESLQTRLEHLAFHDPLTGLANRARYMEQASHALERRDALVAALFIDLDDFKTVNDSMGHKAGDELLAAVAERLRASLRAHDTPARLGGDEFAVLVEDAESMEVVIEIAERVLAALNDPFAVAEAQIAVGASIGVATSSEGVLRAEDLVRNADLAMYRAKGRGKGRLELFEPDMHTVALQRHELKAELQRAVDEDQFVVLYQPVVDLRGGQIAGVEALVRWQHPRLGLVGPDDFIPLAEEAGLIGAIGRSVHGKACARLATWRRASIAGDAFTLNLNLSVREFQSPGLVDQLCEAAAQAGLPTSAITLEITESALMEDAEAGLGRMERIRAAGFRLALDDFGTGYSSLGHLRSLPVDVLKVAKPFVDHVAEREEDAAFLGSILELARTLSLEVIVEGVETGDQARILLGMGVLKVQGYVFSKPVEDRALSALLTLTPLRGFAPEGAAAGFAGVADLFPAVPR